MPTPLDTAASKERRSELLPLPFDFKAATSLAHLGTQQTTLELEKTIDVFLIRNQQSTIRIPISAALEILVLVATLQRT